MLELATLSLAIFMAALAVAGPAQADSYDQFKMWCYDKAPNDRKIAGCNAVIAANRETPEDTAVAYYKRGNVYLDLGRNGQAIENYDRAVQLKPDYVAAWHNRANAYYRTGNYRRALADYDHAIEIWPEFWFGLIHRGIVYGDLGQYERAFR